MSWPLFLQLAPGVALGTMIGTVLASYLDTRSLKMLFGVFVILVATQMFFRIKESNQPGMPGAINRWTATTFIGMSSGSSASVAAH